LCASRACLRRGVRGVPSGPVRQTPLPESPAPQTTCLSAGGLPGQPYNPLPGLKVIPRSQDLVSACLHRHIDSLCHSLSRQLIPPLERARTAASAISTRPAKISRAGDAVPRAASAGPGKFASLFAHGKLWLWGQVSALRRCIRLTFRFCVDHLDQVDHLEVLRLDEADACIDARSSVFVVLVAWSHHRNRGDRSP
jgi:hypothetical protein